MAFSDIDKVNGRTIRKLHHKNDKRQVFGYLSGVIDDKGNLHELQKHDSLTEARTACGFKHEVIKTTLPKSAYKQNQKGYDPHNTK